MGIDGCPGEFTKVDLFSPRVASAGSRIKAVAGTSRWSSPAGFFHVTLQEPNKETRKRTSKMHQKSKLLKHSNKCKRNEYKTNPLDLFSEHSGTQSLKVQRDCLDYCFVTSMISTGISGISRWPSRGMSCIGITAAALQSMIDNWQFYFPLSCGSSRGTCCGKPSLELLCKIISSAVDFGQFAKREWEKRDVEISVQCYVYNR